MARRARIHRRVEVDTWQSHDFLALSAAKPNAQTLWLWLLTCERTIIIPGVIVARPAVMADDLRWPLRAFERCLAEIEAAGMIEVDREVGLVVLSKALVVGDAMRDGAGPAGENAAKSWATALQKLKPCALRDTLTARVQLVISQCGEKISNAFAEAMVMPCARQADAVSDAKRTQGTGNREQREREERAAGPAAPAALPLFGDHPIPQAPAKPDPVADLWAEQERLRKEVLPRSIGLDLTADRRKRIGGLLRAGHSVDALTACLRAYADEIRRGGDGQWFNGDSNWKPDNVARTLGRIGSRPVAPAQPPRRHIPTIGGQR